MPGLLLRRDPTCAFTAGTCASPIPKAPKGTLPEAAFRPTGKRSANTPEKCGQAIAVSGGARLGPVAADQDWVGDGQMACTPTGYRVLVAFTALGPKSHWGKGSIRKT